MPAPAPACALCEGHLAPMTLGDGTAAQTCDRCDGAFFPRGALAKALGAREDLRVAPADDAPAVGPCPACEAVLMQRVPFALARAITVARCPYCEGIFARLSDLPAMRAIPEARRRGEAHAPPTRQAPRARYDVRVALAQAVLAPPLVVAVALTLRGSGLARLVLGGARIPLHELGHAIVAWLCGVSALPIPFGMTWLGEGRAVSVWALLLAALLAALRGLARARAWGWFALVAALLVAQSALTWLTTDATRGMLITVGGSAGELVLSAICIALFHAELPPRLRWDHARWIALAVGAFILAERTLDWRASRMDHGLIPWGSVLGEDGDMQRLLRDHGWAPSRIAARFTLIAHVSVALAALAWLAGAARVALRAWRRAGD